ALGVALLGGMFLVVRPLASQFQFYSADTALAGLLALMFALVVGVWNILAPLKLAAPWSLRVALILWISVFVWGALRSPNRGKCGVDRFYGDNAFGTFDHPISLAAYLLLGIWLLVGLGWDWLRSPRRLLPVVIMLAVLVYALLLTSSKGACFACALGAWFFAA